MKNNMAFDVFILLLSILILSAVAPNVRADPLWLDIHVGSRHSESSYYDETGKHDYNEANYGLGLSFGLTRHFEASLGAFKNSYNIETYYGAVDMHTDAARAIRAGVAIGAMTGYETTPTPNVLMVLPNVVISDGKYRVRLGLIPGSVTVVTLTLGYRF